LIEVDALIDMFGAQTKGHAVLAQFDLVAANSGGSLVLSGLVENLTLAVLRSYFADEKIRRSIFSPLDNPPDQVIHRLVGIGPIYDTAAKLVALRKLLPSFGDRPLAAAAKGIAGRSGTDIHLLIVGFDYNRNRARFFRSALAGSDTGWGSGDATGATLAEAIHASTNAPINYFEKPAELPGAERYWDGGITGCNNPVLAALTETIVLGHDAKDVIALSLGTGTVQLPLAAPGVPDSPFLAPRPDPSLTTDLQKLATAIIDDPPDAASFISHVMTGGIANLPDNVVSRIVRMSPLLSPAKDVDQN
jgi:patatin-like phospholipase/acyl hydrolase